MVIEYANVQVSKHKVLVAIATSYLSFIHTETDQLLRLWTVCHC